MARGSLIALLTDADLDLEVIQPGLLDLAAASLGNSATPADGFDSVFLDAVNAFESGAAEVATLDPLLIEHFAPFSAATDDTLAGDTAQLATDLKNGDQVLADMDALFGSPAPPPPPPGGGGGGGGGGGATSAIISCAFGKASVNSSGISTNTPITIASRMNEIVVVLPRLVLSRLPDSIKLSSNIVFSRHRATVL